MAWALSSRSVAVFLATLLALICVRSDARRPETPQHQVSTGLARVRFHNSVRNISSGQDLELSRVKPSVFVSSLGSIATTGTKAALDEGVSNVALRMGHLDSAGTYLVISGITGAILFSVFAYVRARAEKSGPHGGLPTLAARLVYLSFNAIFIVQDFVLGFLVFRATRSLTIEVDFLSFGCELVAVGINLTVELVKTRVSSPRTVVQLDLAGGILSLALLLCVGLVGLYNAAATVEELEEGHPTTPARHLGVMIHYSAFSLGLSAVNLAIFGGLKAQLLPENGEAHDRLNLLANLAHSLVDAASSFAVFATSLWLRFGVEPSGWIELHETRVWIDILGSVMVCFCIVLSIIWLLEDIRQAYQLSRALPAEGRT